MRSRSRSVIVAVVLAAAVLGIGPHGAAGPRTAQAATTLEVCGSVTLYVKPTALLPGALTIGLIPYVIAPGATVPASVAVGSNLCVRLTLNLLGNISELVVVGVDSTTTLQLCGRVDAYVAATATSQGRLTLAGKQLVIASGTTLPANVAVGADLCATLQLNLFGQIKGATTTVNVTTTLEVCGQVTAYVAAGASTTGSLTIAGVTRTIAPGTTVAAEVHAGAIVRLRLELDGYLRVSKVTVLAVGASVSGLCSPAPTPTPTPYPTPTPSAAPTAGPTAGPGSSSSPAPTSSPGSPTPTPGSSSGPNPTDKPGSSASPAPSGGPGQTANPSPSGGVDHAGASPSPDASGAPPAGGIGGETGGTICPPLTGAAPVSYAAELAPNEPAIWRAGQLMSAAAIPFGLFLLGMVAMEILHRARRREAELARSQAELAATESEA